MCAVDCWNVNFHFHHGSPFHRRCVLYAAHERFSFVWNYLFGSENWHHNKRVSLYKLQPPGFCFRHCKNSSRSPNQQLLRSSGFPLLSNATPCASCYWLSTCYFRSLLQLCLWTLRCSCGYCFGVGPCVLSFCFSVFLFCFLGVRLPGHDGLFTVTRVWV